MNFLPCRASERRSKILLEICRKIFNENVERVACEVYSVNGEYSSYSNPFYVTYCGEVRQTFKAGAVQIWSKSGRLQELQHGRKLDGCTDLGAVPKGTVSSMQTVHWGSSNATP